MAIRTVRLDQEAEAALREVREATGLPTADVFKRGLHTLRGQVKPEGARRPYEIYREIDLGPGGYAVSPATETRHGVARAIRRKLHR